MEIGEHDPVSGQTTTGHEWNGIKELNSPVPWVVFFFLIITILFAVVYWVLMPAFPLGRTHTKGLLGFDQRAIVQSEVKAASAQRAAWERRIEQTDYAAIQADPVLMKTVNQAGGALFKDNCAVCHGANGRGGPGYPDLTARSWLWGGDPETIAETLRVGINSTRLKTRISDMAAFGAGPLDRPKVLDVVAYVQSLGGASERTTAGADSIARGQAVFTTHCVSCHGPDAKGKHTSGAPDLTDKIWIYGGDRESIFRTVDGGRKGHMPHWEDRLSATQRKVLTLYVLSLPGKPA